MFCQKYENSSDNYAILTCNINLPGDWTAVKYKIGTIEAEDGPLKSCQGSSGNNTLKTAVLFITVPNLVGKSNAILNIGQMNS